MQYVSLSVQEKQRNENTQIREIKKRKKEKKELSSILFINQMKYGKKKICIVSIYSWNNLKKKS